MVNGWQADWIKPFRLFLIKKKENKMLTKCEYCNERVSAIRMPLHLKHCVNYRRAQKIERSKVEAPKTAKNKKLGSKKDI